MLHAQQKPTPVERRNSVMLSESSGNELNHLKSEMNVQNRKYERLEYKEKRLQVTIIDIPECR